jgi:RNA-directed DNA polymerase
MEEVVRRENLLAAYQRVKGNGGAPGIDGMTVEQLADFCRWHWARVREELLGGTYAPQAVRRVDIPKPDGKGVRTLGIPTVLDRLIQQALNQVLTPIFDPTFSEASFGFRPGRSTHGAVVRAREHMAAGHRWVVDLDLERFFDRVNHDVLMARLARRIGDRRVLLLIRRYLQAGMMEGGLVSPREEGTPQGGPLSPLLSNVLLDELDKELERRGHRFVRYADDCNVYVKSKAAGERVMASLERFLRERLRLTVNRDKSAVARPWERKFLGYTVTTNHRPRLKVSPKSLTRLKTKLRLILRSGRGRNLASVVMELNRVTRGWVAYFQLADVKASFEELDAWIRRKLRCILWRQWKTPRTRLKELRRRGLTTQDARAAAYHGCGPWRSAGASPMNRAVPTAALRELGLVSLFDEYRRLQSPS